MEIVEYFQKEHVIRSAGIIYFPKGVRIEITDDGDDIEISSYWDGITDDYQYTDPKHDSGEWRDDDAAYGQFITRLFMKED